MVDSDIDVRISMVENRIAILNSIGDPSVTEVKERGLRLLKENKAFYEHLKRNESKENKKSAGQGLK